MRIKGLLSQLEKPSVEHGTGKNVGILHLESHVLYSSDDKNATLHVEATEYYIRTLMRSLLLPGKSFCNAAKMGLTD